MKIGIIGSGRIGGTAARLFARSGHEVALSNSRGPESLSALVSSMSPNVTAMTPVEAARFGEVVLLALPWRKRDELPSAPNFTGKIVIDAMNPYSALGRVMDLGETTSSEEVAQQLPGARLVKAFNTMRYDTLGTGSKRSGEDRLVLFVAGDDVDAKKIVSTLIETIGFAPMDTGTLRGGGRRQQPGSPIYAHELTVPQAREALRRMA
jgi:8-hydroxy-5-deazaflavin:NADPH oxidoreductase